MIRFHRRYLDDAEKHRRWIDPRLYAVRVEVIKTYLVGKSWKPVHSDRPGFFVFEEPSPSADGPLYQFAPESEAWEGYPAQVYDLLAALAAIEDRYAGDVLRGSRGQGSNGVAHGETQQTPSPQP